jgi:hypothetical protein
MLVVGFDHDGLDSFAGLNSKKHLEFGRVHRRALAGETGSELSVVGPRNKFLTQLAN